MKSDKIPTSPRENRRDRLNWLSIESAADRTYQTRSDKLGDYYRPDRRTESWARWMLETRHGIPAPDDAVLHAYNATVYRFVLKIQVRAWWEPRRGPRGGMLKPIMHPASVHLEPVSEPFEIPEWCRPVRFADNWHACHQAGLPMGVCEDSGANLRYRPYAVSETSPAEPESLRPEPPDALRPSDEPPSPTDPDADGATSQGAAETASEQASRKLVSLAWTYGSRLRLSEYRMPVASDQRVSPGSFDGPSCVVPLFLKRKSPDPT